MRQMGKVQISGNHLRISILSSEKLREEMREKKFDG